MMRWSRACWLATAAVSCFVSNLVAQADEPRVTVGGQTYTPRSIVERNMGSEADQTTPFTPHRVIGNIYYVGTRTLSSFLIVTPAGHMLLNTTYERNVEGIRSSAESLGFRFGDVKLVLGNHAHGDHMEGDARLQELTGAQVVVMADDRAALEGIRPGGKLHPVDRTVRDGERVELGGTVLTAHLTAGHTPGCTAWTTTVQEGGRDYDVVFFCSLRAPARLTPETTAQLERSFALVRRLPCDVPLGDHPAQYRMEEKYGRLIGGNALAFVEPAGCMTEVEIQEAMFRALPPAR
ncbi:MAG: MBL fold metallo-hydrolase [Gemmatimonadetes bacterium]|nr:MBL fold metallo-hydrolase [Gemmatimonadota bacterium]